MISPKIVEAKVNQHISECDNGEEMGHIIGIELSSLDTKHDLKESALSDPIDTDIEHAIPLEWLTVSPSYASPCPTVFLRIKILPWNIAGWWGKAKDGNPLNYFIKFDLVLLQETWSHLPVYVQGFKVYSCPAYKNNPQGCFQAELAILVALHINTELITSSGT